MSSSNIPAGLVLDDEGDTDRPLATQGGFDGATLQIAAEDPSSDPVDINPDVAFSSSSQKASLLSDTDDGDAGTRKNISRNRPGSVVGQASIRSTASSRTSVRPGVEKTDENSRSFYCYKGSHFEKAVEVCKSLVNPDMDGDLKSTWLLTEIDHWDFEREKIVLLCERSIIVAKFNFINEKLYEFKRILLHIIKAIGIGDFSYPNKSLMPERRHGGIQIRWGTTQELSFGQRWNPWCSDIPWLSLSHHPLIYNRREMDTATYNVDEFFESLVAAASKAYRVKKPGESIQVIEGPITIESYASPVSLVFNQSNIGYFRDRNGVSF